MRITKIKKQKNQLTQKSRLRAKNLQRNGHGDAVPHLHKSSQSETVQSASLEKIRQNTNISLLDQKKNTQKIHI